MVSSAVPAGNFGHTLIKIEDGTSNTLLLGEISKIGWKFYRSWIRGYDSDSSAAMVSGKNITNPINSTDYSSGNYNNVSLSSNHTGVVNVAMADGSVRALSETIPVDTLRRIASRNGGEAVTLE